MIADDGIMFDERPAIDDAVSPNEGASINDPAVEYDCPLIEGSMFRNIGMRGNYTGQHSDDRFQERIEADSWLGTCYVPNGDERVALVLQKRRQHRIITEKRISQ